MTFLPTPRPSGQKHLHIVTMVVEAQEVLIAMGVCPQCGKAWDIKQVWLQISTVIPQKHCGCLKKVGLSCKTLAGPGVGV